MPTWTPNREDVRFDAELAERAATECEEVASRLSLVLSTLSDPAGEAQTGWTGVAREGFDRGWLRIDDDELATRSALWTLADHIRMAATAAATEQQHRVDERARWQRELDAEQAANPVCVPGEPC